MSAPTFPMAAAAEQAAAALAAAEQRGAKAAVAHLRSVIADTQDFRARADAAEQRAEALAAEVARLRAAWADAVAEVAAMGAEPDRTGQVLTERRSPATRAALREVARMLAEAQPAEVADD
jgi:enamine deaminase RidA (YjgF/YER057c/UK114 family)